VNFGGFIPGPKFEDYVIAIDDLLPGCRDFQLSDVELQGQRKDIVFATNKAGIPERIGDWSDKDCRTITLVNAELGAIVDCNRVGEGMTMDVGPRSKETDLIESFVPLMKVGGCGYLDLDARGSARVGGNKVKGGHAVRLDGSDVVVAGALVVAVDGEAVDESERRLRTQAEATDLGIGIAFGGRSEVSEDAGHILGAYTWAVVSNRELRIECRRYRDIHRAGRACIQCVGCKFPDDGCDGVGVETRRQGFHHDTVGFDGEIAYLGEARRRECVVDRDFHGVT
jgi:hypothetical protein